jgi:germination protein M
MIRTRTILILAAIAIAIVVAACGASSGGLGTVPPASPPPAASPASPDETPGAGDSAEPSAAPSGAPGSTPSTSPSGAPAGTIIVRTYFILEGQQGSRGLVPTLREIPETTAVATAAMTALLAGPTSGESAGNTISTAIPDGTRLLGLTIKNGVATVDLSTEFDSGAGASVHYRLAQVVYTLTQFSSVRSVAFQVEGKTMTVFGIDGIDLSSPVGRDRFDEMLPDIFVDRPAWRAALGNPGRVTGSANVFEATFRIALLDAAGKTLTDQQVMATCGTGCRGTFDVTLTYTVAKAQYGTLRVYNPSAKDGTPESVRDYPVWLVPAG